MQQRITPKVSNSLRIIRTLRDIPLFANCSDPEYATIAGFCELFRAPAETKVFSEGDPATAFFFVAEGLVELVKRSPTGKEKVVEFMETGATFAEAVVFSGAYYPVSAMALMDSQLLRIDAVRFRAFLKKHPAVSTGMLSALSMRLHELIAQISSLTLLNAEQRVGHYLLQNLDPTEPGAPVRNVPNRRKELASRLNLTPETLCRVLATFRRRGWIASPSSSTLRVIDSHGLKALLGDESGRPEN